MVHIIMRQSFAANCSLLLHLQEPALEVTESD
jgi:hypothetical protein